MSGEGAAHNADFADPVDEALDEIGRQARALEACSICWAYVHPDLRDRHLDWHASLAREVARERLPQVYGDTRFPPVSRRDEADQ